jgi:hypothetical protein
MGIPVRIDQVRKPGKEFGPKTAFLDSLIGSLFERLIAPFISAGESLFSDDAALESTHARLVFRMETYLAPSPQAGRHGVGMEWEIESRLRGIHIQDGRRLFQPIKEGLEQVLHRRQGVIIE